MKTTQPRQGRTIVLGLDSVDLNLVNRWAAQGLLPCLKDLIEQNPLAHLSSVSEVLQGALWPSLLTGRSAGHHGTFYNTQLTNGSYLLDNVDAAHAELERFHEILAKHRVRSALVDLPSDHPKKRFDGVQIVDWLTEFQFWRFETHPAELKQEIENELGVHNPGGGYGRTVNSPEGHRKLRTMVEESLRKKFALTRKLLERKDLDLIFVVFAEAHKAGHFLWKYMDTAHPEHERVEPYLRDSLLHVYQLLDSALRTLIAHLTPEDNLIVFSDHGMQANYRGDHFMDVILERLGLCHSASQARLEQSDSSASAGDAASRMRESARTLFKRMVPRALKRRLRRRFGAAARLDWRQIKAFVLPTDRNSYLRINLQGREPSGIVAPGEEYEQLLSFIEREFRSLVNLDTAQPAVECVFRVQKMFPGPKASHLPDIAILWRSDAPINRLVSPRIGQLDMRVREERSGNHHSQGFLMVRGPAFKSEHFKSRGDILQIAPTLLALHGISRPEAYEMQPLTELLKIPVVA